MLLSQSYVEQLMGKLMGKIDLEKLLGSYYKRLYNDYKSLDTSMVRYLYEKLFPASIGIEGQYELFSRPIGVHGLPDFILYVDLYNCQFFLITGYLLSDEGISCLLQSDVFRWLVYVMFYMKENIFHR